MGLPPVRIDVLTEFSGLTFAEAWPGRVQASFGPLTVDVIGREAFIRNKRATGRVRDLAISRPSASKGRYRLRFCLDAAYGWATACREDRKHSPRPVVSSA